MEKCGKVGEQIACVKCGKTKKPLGRSSPLEMTGMLCTDECAGYNLAPFPTDLWPGEVCEMVHPTPAKEGAGE